LGVTIEVAPAERREGIMKDSKCKHLYQIEPKIDDEGFVTLRCSLCGDVIHRVVLLGFNNGGLND